MDKTMKAAIIVLIYAGVSMGCRAAEKSHEGQTQTEEGTTEISDTE